MKITAISQQAKNKDRVNVMVDGVYRLSLDIFQVADLGLRVGREYTEAELVALEEESQFGKLYARALEYCMSRPHSVREVRDYLWRKTRTTRYKVRGTNEIKERPGVSEQAAARVLKRVEQKGYVNDEQFARWWVENRHRTKGVSRRKLQAELMAKGVASEHVQAALLQTERSEKAELIKMIEKKQKRYPDRQKLLMYLARQGFSYDAITEALDEVTTDESR
jgi:regulatory protein